MNGASAPTCTIVFLYLYRHCTFDYDGMLLLVKYILIVFIGVNGVRKDTVIVEIGCLNVASVYFAGVVYRGDV